MEMNDASTSCYYVEVLRKNRELLGIDHETFYPEVPNIFMINNFHSKFEFKTDVTVTNKHIKRYHGTDAEVSNYYRRPF